MTRWVRGARTMMSSSGRMRAGWRRAAGAGKDLVNEPMIRHWCEAMGDTNPAYRGPDAIAPPTMLQAWTMGGLSGHADRSGAYDELSGLLDGAGYTSVVATDCEQEYLRPLRPGDRITFDAVIESVSARKTTKLGTGHFVTTRMDIRADGELAGTHRFRILKYAPADVAEAAGIARGRHRSRRARRPEAAGTQRPQEPSSPGARAAPGPTPPSRHQPRQRRILGGRRRHRLLIQRCTGCGDAALPLAAGVRCLRFAGVGHGRGERCGNGLLLCGDAPSALPRLRRVRRP